MREYEQHQRQLDSERAERLRRTYVDMADHLNRTDAWLDKITDERVVYSDLTGGWRDYDLPLTARVQLYCPVSLVRAWEEYERYIEQIIDNEVGKEQSGRAAYADLNYAMVAAVTNSLQKLRVLLRDAADELSSSPATSRPAAPSARSLPT